MGDAGAMLGVDQKTLRDWLEKEGIEPTQDKYDARRKWVSAAQVRAIADAHERTPRKAAAMADLLDRIEALERRVRELEDRALYIPAPSVRVTHSQPRSAPAQPAGDGLIAIRSAARIAVEHGANSFDGAREWQWTEKARESRDGIVEFIWHYLSSRPRTGVFHICDQSDCRCATLMTGVS